LGLLVPHLGPASVDELLSQRDQLSLELRQTLARRFMSLGGPYEATLALARDEHERHFLIAEALPLAPDAARRAADLAAWVISLPDDARRDALSILGTVLSRLGQGLALVEQAASADVALALALGDRRCAKALSFSLAAWALADQDGWLLPRLAPIAGAFAMSDRLRLVAAALEHVASEPRHAALAGDRVSLRHIAPLLAQIAGDAGLVAVGRAAFDVARVFP
jgi:hypothetical protein